MMYRNQDTHNQKITRSIHRWLLPAVLAVMLTVMLLPQASFAAADARTVVQGHKHVDVDIYQVPGQAKAQARKAKKAAANLPAKYDPREDAAFRQAIPVRDQGYTNMCWAYAVTTAAEISWLRESGQVQELSPAHLAYFFYDRVTDPLGGTKGDYNLSYGNWVDDGGSCVNTMLHLTTYSGLGDEALTPLTDANANNRSFYKRLCKSSYPASLAYRDALQIENSTYYASTDVATAKNMIDRYGAVVVSMDFASDYFQDGLGDSGIYYKPDAFSQNSHEVTIIGWDDNYHKENFASFDSERYKEDYQQWSQDYDQWWRSWGKKWDDALTPEPPQMPEDSDYYTLQPASDGAWIVQNSWGSEWGEDGYLYVSYESTDILSDGILGLDMQMADTYDHNFQYDGNAYTNNDGNLDENPPYTMQAGDRAANVFTADGSDVIEAVGLTQWNDGPSSYTIELYRNVSNPKKPATSGHLAATTEVTTQSPGYQTIPLPTPVTVDPGEKFAIVVTFQNTTNMGIEAEGRYDFLAASKAGTSLYAKAGSSTWKDAHTVNYQKSGQGFTFRIKALGNSLLKGTSIRKLTRGKKAITVKWKAQPLEADGGETTGYQVRYSLKSSMKGAKKVTVAGAAKTSKKLTKLKAKKKYYVQVRTYYKTDGKTYYSAWSAKKSIKT